MFELYTKYKDIILYLFFGVCTTVVNMVVFWFCAYPLGVSALPSTMIAWVFAVLFAYVTNRRWVFHSKAEGFDESARELVAFFGCRLGTGFVDWFTMYLMVDCLHYNDLIVKALANILVVILNFVASKLLIFRSK